jgi:type 1 fimbriae regulatory protein FimB/type 1 fimbriae regulatory protein FimE
MGTLATVRLRSSGWWRRPRPIGTVTAMLMAYRHGLRVAELVDLRWDQIDFDTANLAVRRTKRGSPSTHPVMGDELRALRRLSREQEPKSAFVSERGSPFTTAGFARLVERAGAAAELGFKAHPHMLRHACGFALANTGHDTRALQAYLGHKNIQHTVRYTELAPDRFTGLLASDIAAPWVGMKFVTPMRARAVRSKSHIAAPPQASCPKQNGPSAMEMTRAVRRLASNFLGEDVPLWMPGRRLINGGGETRAN